MNKKTFVLNLALVLVTSLLTAILVAFGTHYLHVHASEQEEGAFSFFSSKEKQEEVHYVEVKNQVITLKGATPKERYLLMDLAFIANSKEQVTGTENNLPKIKGVLVEMFSGMEYSAVRSMSVSDMRIQLMARMEGAFGTQLPFNDVTVSKMVFQ